MVPRSSQKPVNLHRLLRNSYALSTVVTTLIILVISVLLAGVVTYFAINVTSTRAQNESLSITKTHVWFNSGTAVAQAAFKIVNTGGRDVVIQKITVRGQTAAWTNVFYSTSSSLPDDLSFVSSLAADSKVSNGGKTYFLSAAATDVVLPSGQIMMVYVNSPDSVSVNDVGLTVGVTVFTSESMYYQEANVQTPVASASATAPPTPSPTPEPQVSAGNKYVWYSQADNVVQAAFIVANPTSQDITISQVQVGGDPQDASCVFDYGGNFASNIAISYISHVDVGSSVPGIASSTLSAASYPITVHAGDSVVIYVKNPSLLTYKGYMAIRVGATIQPSGSFDELVNIQTV